MGAPFRTCSSRQDVALKWLTPELYQDANTPPRHSPSRWRRCPPTRGVPRRWAGCRDRHVTGNSPCFIVFSCQGQVFGLSKVGPETNRKAPSNSRMVKESMQSLQRLCPYSEGSVKGHFIQFRRGVLLRKGPRLRLFSFHIHKTRYILENTWM